MNIPSKTDPYLISNNAPDIVCLEASDRKYKVVKSSILYDARIYVYIPFEADDELRICVRKLNELRPLNFLDEEYDASDKRAEEIQQIQEECVFLWIKCWVNKCIYRRTSIAQFLLIEKHFQN
eukprot:196569_1